MIRISEAARKALRKEDASVQRLFDQALAKLEAASPLERQQFLMATNPSKKFTTANVRWTMRASRKYRLLVDREGDTYVIRGIVGRGDHRFYP